LKKASRRKKLSLGLLITLPNTNYACKRGLREMLPKEYVYTLRLEHDCWYVGRSSSPNLRITDHWSGSGAAWTRLHPVIEVWDVCSMASPLSEEHVTEELMVKFSIDKVRGGCYSQVDLPDDIRRTLEKKLQSAKKECFRCGSKDHFVEQCPVELSHRRFVSEVDGGGGGMVEYTCFTCGVAGHFARDCDSYVESYVVEILPPSRKRHAFSEQDNEYESSCSDYGDGCFRCGNSSHWSSECYATFDVNGRRI
jgi:predicted GIY-YIG superfamily endonuclease